MSDTEITFTVYGKPERGLRVIGQCGLRAIGQWFKPGVTEAAAKARIVELFEEYKDLVMFDANDPDFCDDDSMEGELSVEGG